MAISMAFPSVQDDAFYRNAMGDEVVFVTDGEGVLESQFGELPYRKGDYLVIPRGIFHRYRLAGPPQIHLVIESSGAVRTPARYRNPFGQLLEHSPFCERDIRRPERLPVFDAAGEYSIVVKKENALHEVIRPRPARRRRLGRLLLSLGAQHRGLRAHRRPRAPAAAGPPDPRGRPLRDLLLRAASVRLPPAGDPGPLRAQQRDVGRGPVLRQRRVHEPQGHRVRVHHAASRRPAPRPACREVRGVRRPEGDERAGGA